tara:strand:- start:464 stop:955 length:492 start_codon:yes stop_codon:yes gene_type:complete
MNKTQGFIGGAALACLALTAGCNSRADEETAAPATTAEAPATTETTAAATEAPTPEVEFASLTGDAEAGKKVFAKCMTCHSVDAGVNKVGPSLHGVVGREAGSVADYSYSTANKDSGITWTPEELYVYLADPQATIPGTKMAFPGLKDPQDRANVIAYLETQS